MDYKPALDEVEDELDALSFGLPKPVQAANTATAQLKVEGTPCMRRATPPTATVADQD